ncbi:ArsI/CadI family heavy metal resistance metalloenzyme [Caenimonas sp. SL110]|uniref:ArsI/CadI family heavy metal resistance metalloenzyme n=1 Tax=Caenimonas sp. SL110 TaxID=1450524 RepID=UPI000653572E|nr:ArsI/CadI family heavy metal resistance metalloenzyme [Caenimonas sp. SL110]
MKRFHVHVHVEDLDKNIAFYSAMFNQQPARTEGDYAKWMLQDPPVNFAISTRGSGAGVDHLGIQVDNEQDLQALKDNAAKADLSVQDEGKVSCCYARSDKYWVTDPQGIAWEQFHTLTDIPVFSEKPEVAPEPAAAKSCCGGSATATASASTAPTRKATSCC